MTLYNPKVTIVIPVYNGADYLETAIDSALAQTYNNIEIIVVNDGSNDAGATDKIAKSYGNKIRYFKKNNGGVSTALNIAIEKMQGDYMSWLSHDDVYLKDKVQKQVEFLNSLSDKDSVIYADFELINEKGELLEKCVQDHDLLEKVPIYSLLRGIINGITMLIPAKVFKTHGKFNEYLKCAQDYDMWFRLINDYTFVHQPAILTQTRIHSGQGTASNPLAISEANELWVHMLESIDDRTKRAAEGDLFAFYLGMVKFLRHTPYNIVLEYCIKKLEYFAADQNEISISTYGNITKATRTIEDLLIEEQKLSTAYFANNIIRQLKSNSMKDALSETVSQILVGSLSDNKTTAETERVVSKLFVEKKKPRILFCSGYWLTGGVERVASILFDQIKDEYELFLITPYDGRPSSVAVPPYVTHIIMSADKYKDYDTVTMTYALLFEVDVVVGMNWEEVQLSLYDMCNAVGIKTIASNHEIYFYPYFNVNLHSIISKRVDSYKKLGAVLWPTNFSAAAYGLQASNSYLMPNPNTYSIENFHGDSQEKILLCVGRFTDYVKRIDRILESFSVVSKTMPTARLVLVGKYNNDVEFMPGDSRSVNDLMKDYNVDESKVEFVGEVDNVDAYYAKASLLLVASNNEGFCMVINEAACYGVPAVCMRIPGLEDLVDNGTNGYIIEQGDIDSYSSKIQELLSDDKLRKAIGRNAKKYVKKFDSREIGRKWKYLMDAVISGDKFSSDTDKLLRKELDYTVGDYREYSKLLMNEMDKIISMIQEGPVTEEAVRAHKEIDNLRQENYELSSELNQLRNSKRWLMTSSAIDMTVGNVRRIRKSKRDKEL